MHGGMWVCRECHYREAVLLISFQPHQVQVCSRCLGWMNRVSELADCGDYRLRVVFDSLEAR